MFLTQFKSICKQKNTSVSAVLDALSMSRGNIARWKTGLNPKFETKLKIANYLEVPVESLLSEEEIEHYYAFNGALQEQLIAEEAIGKNFEYNLSIKNKPTVETDDELLKLLYDPKIKAAFEIFQKLNSANQDVALLQLEAIEALQDKQGNK